MFMSIPEQKLGTSKIYPMKNKKQPIVAYQNIKKSYGDLEILKGVDLSIRPGEKLALIGPSGSGKTTIIRMLMTLEKPTSGFIKVEGE